MAFRCVDDFSAHTTSTPFTLQVATPLIMIQDEVRAHFGWSEEADRTSAQDLINAAAELDSERRLDHDSTMMTISERIASHRGEVAVIGAAADPPEVAAAVDDDCLLIIADGAFGAVLDLPSEATSSAIDATIALVTDGDGGDDVLEAALSTGMPLILHAHGHNRSQWKNLLAAIANRCDTPPTPLALTHQTSAPLSGAWNPGGFTDGDRSACIAHTLLGDRSRIRTIGHRTDVVGRWSGATAPARKMEKLVWMARVLDLLDLPIDDFVGPSSDAATLDVS